jgi:DNA repair protein RadC
VSIGTLDSALIHPREIFKPAFIHSAHSIIIAHNHPSGDTTPSAEDDNITEQLDEAGELLKIELLDHVVIGVNEWYSYS